jgi:hypothetical protein
MTPEALLAEIRELRALVASWKNKPGESTVDSDRWTRVVHSVQQLSASVPEASRREIHAELQDLITALKGSQGDIQGRLREIRDGRKGLKGYGNLRSHRQGQRIRTEV